jgi:hypothetical protein
MFSADNGNIYIPDMFFMGVLNRTINVIDAISCLTERRNFIATGPLVRIHLDTLLCLSYLIKTKNPDSIIMEILKGKQLRKIKDEEGYNLTDTRLRDYARPLFPQVDNVYKETSKLIHFSDKQLFTCFETVDDNGRFTAIIGKGSSGWKEKDIIVSLSCTISITEIILAIARGWIVQKEKK